MTESNGNPPTVSIFNHRLSFSTGEAHRASVSSTNSDYITAKQHPDYYFGEELRDEYSWYDHNRISSNDTSYRIHREEGGQGGS